MQAHACDLRAEVERDWATLVDSADIAANPAVFDGFVHQAVDDWRLCPLTAGPRRLLEYGEKVTRDASGCTRADIESLRLGGWSDSAIHDAVQVIAYFNYINRVADALGVATEPGMPSWGARGPH